jgi:pyridoxine 4-dehydrogenase
MKQDTPGAQELLRIAGLHLVTVSQLAIAWLLQRSPVLLPIPGTSKVAHLEENIAAASLKLSTAEWAEVEASVGQSS